MHGTDQSPIVVTLLPSPKGDQESPKNKTSGFDNSSPDWWMVRLTAVIAIIAVLQTIVFGMQARRLKQTIDKMDELAEGQAKDMRDSIHEATRAASAMEGVAQSMAGNVASVRETVSINREIADRQKLISELQSRAYLSVDFLGMVPQNARTGMRFEPRFTVTNKGNTPACKVKVIAQADLVQMRLLNDFRFHLPEFPQENPGSIIASGSQKISSAVVPILYADQEVTRIKAGAEVRLAMWGKVSYEDAFGIARFVMFGLTFFWLEDGQTVMSNDTVQYNDSN
jgi:hypothetical protein